MYVLLIFIGFIIGRIYEYIRRATKKEGKKEKAPRIVRDYGENKYLLIIHETFSGRPTWHREIIEADSYEQAELIASKKCYDKERHSMHTFNHYLVKVVEGEENE